MSNFEIFIAVNVFLWVLNISAWVYFFYRINKSLDK